VEFQPKDRRILENALSAAFEFASLKERGAIIREAIDGYQYSARIRNALQFMAWEASAAVVAFDLLERLGGHVVEPGIPAFAVLAQAVEHRAGAEHRALISDLRRRMGWADLDPSLLREKDWQDPRPPEEIAERILAKDALKPMYYLRRALAAAEAVVRVDVYGEAMGTGFLVAPDLLLTCHHVIHDEKEARAATFRFFFEEQDPDAEEGRAPVTVRPDSEQPFLYTNTKLDFTVVRLMGVPEGVRCLPLRPAMLQRDAQVVIIQHPDAKPKQICMQHNLVASADSKTVKYYASTDHGSSGSPVLENQFAVVAIHRSFASVKGSPNQGHNVGTSMIAALDDLRRNAPAVYEKLRILPA